MVSTPGPQNEGGSRDPGRGGGAAETRALPSQLEELRHHLKSQGLRGLSLAWEARVVWSSK